MKEKEFDEIGKHLYDLEAEPPKDGWNRIGTTLHRSSPTAPWLAKNWWKPLLLLIPAFFYIGYTEIYHTASTSALRADVTPVDELRPSENKIAGKGKDGSVQSGDSAKLGEHKWGNANKVQQVETATAFLPDNIASTPDRNVLAGKVRTYAVLPGIPVGNENEAPTDGSAGAALDIINAFSPQDTTSRVYARQLFSDEAVLTTHDDERLSQPARRAENSTVPLVKDSVAESLEQELKLAEDNSGKPAEKFPPTWRLNVSVMPQYVNRNIQPIASDEVLVTKIENGSSATRRGLEASIGIARSLSKHWYVDGRISYNNLRQEINHSFSDGTVDTLLRVQQPDQTVRVTPVYEVTNREIKGNYHYASVSLGTTYYFWATTKRRFNFSVSADMHHLLSAEIMEKVDGQWVSVNNSLSSKNNYSITIGAGYNITLYKGLELMIRPSLRYFGRDIRSAELPYKMNQRTAGINFMLSKTIGKN
ncbi:MAG TPA: hypothetical protein VFZ52_17470 [Chryseolinea sp.]